MGSYAAVISGGLVAGQILGGLLASADLFGLSWRPVFLINVPVGIVLYAAAQRVLPPGGSPNARGLDVPGLLLLTPALLALVIPPVMGRELGWPAWGWALLAASAALFAGFVYAERRASAPLLPGALLKLPGVVPAIGTLLLTMAAFSGLMFATALYLQSGLDYSALEAGLTFIPPSAVFATVSLNWQRLPAQWHPRLPAAGIPLAAAGFAATAWAMGTAQPLAVMLAAMTLGSLGMGIAYSPVMNLALRRVPLPQASDASGLLVTVIQVGQVLGIAAFGTLYLSLADDFRWAGEASLLAVAGTLVAAAVPAARLARR
jgi:MFS family permease